MRVQLPLRALPLAIFPICLGVLAILPHTALSQSSRVIRLPTVAANPADAQIQLASVETDEADKADQADEADKADKGAARFVLESTVGDRRIARLPNPVGNFTAKRPTLAERTTAPMPTPAPTPVPMGVEKGSDEPTLAEAAAPREAASAGEDPLAQQREQNRIAEPLSGMFDFEQPMEASVPPSESEWEVPPSGVASAVLPRSMELQAQQLLRSATSLADRGAIYSANREFLRVMRMVTQSLDTKLGRQTHTRALAAGLRALEEAEDFSLANSDSVEDDVHLASYIKGHRTPVLKDSDLDQMTPLRAIQRYYEYAREQLTIAAGNTRLGSQALFALGRAEMFLDQESPNSAPGAPKSIAFYHAALSADPQNVRASNELAVMLARRGRLQDASRILQKGVEVSPMPIALSNLASIFEQLGDPRSAIARRQASQLADGSTAEAQTGAPRITWVDPEAFAAANDPATMLVEKNIPTVRNVNSAAPIRPHQGATKTIRTAMKRPVTKDPAILVPMPDVRNAKPRNKPTSALSQWW